MNFLIFFHFGGPKCSSCWEDSNIVSELSLDNIWLMLWPKNRQNRPGPRFPRFMGSFSAKIWVKCYPTSILRPYVEPSHQHKHFGPQIWMKIGKFIFTSHIILNIFISCAWTQKAVFMGENGIALLFTSHGAELAKKTWKKIDFGEKWNTLMYVLLLPK